MDIASQDLEKKTFSIDLKVYDAVLGTEVPFAFPPSMYLQRHGLNKEPGEETLRPGYFSIKCKATDAELEDLYKWVASTGHIKIIGCLEV